MKENIKEILDSGASGKMIVDALLELDRDNVDLGVGFTKESLRESRRNSTLIYEAIGRVDKKLGELLLNHVDV